MVLIVGIAQMKAEQNLYTASSSPYFSVYVFLCLSVSFSCLLACSLLFLLLSFFLPIFVRSPHSIYILFPFPFSSHLLSHISNMSSVYHTHSMSSQRSSKFSAYYKKPQQTFLRIIIIIIIITHHHHHYLIGVINFLFIYFFAGDFLCSSQ